jgi:uncharacterized Zn-binding protein involved in type VI secretion
MPGISRNSGTDVAGGALIEGSPNVFADNDPAVRLGDSVAGHGPGPHAAPVMADANGGEVYANNILVCHQGNVASCGHPSSGSGDVYVHDLAAAAAQQIGLPRLNIGQDEAASIIEGRAVERAAGVDPDINEPTEYGDGGVGGEARYNNSSPVTGQSGPIDSAPYNEQTPSPQPSNENGEYIEWLPHVDSRVKPEVVRKLEAMSQALGYRIVITSGYRSPEYNENVGGVSRSQHMEGNAVDCSQTGLSIPQRQDFIQAAIDAGFTGIGIYNSFTHLDIAGRRAWGNNGSRTTLPRYPWALETLRANGYPY